MANDGATTTAIFGLDDRYQPLSAMIEQWSAVIFRFAAVAYLLRTVPLLMWAVSIPGTFLVFLVGLGAGALLVACCAVVLIWMAFEKPKDGPVDRNSMARLHRLGEQKAEKEAAVNGSQKAEDSGASSASSPQDAPPHPRGLPSSLSRHSLHSILFSSLQAGLPIPTRPPVASGGCFEGILWIGTPDTYVVGSGLIAKWPPPDTGPLAVATRWHGKVAGGALVLRMYLVQDGGAEGSSPRATGEEQTDLAGLLDSKPESSPLSSHYLTIPLTGLQVAPVTEGLGTKSVWSKRAPLRLSHPSGQELHEGHSSLYLWAVSGAFKEQWRNALFWAANMHRTRGLAALEAAYKSYCADTTCLAAEHPGVYHIKGVGAVQVAAPAASGRKGKKFAKGKPIPPPPAPSPPAVRGGGAGVQQRREQQQQAGEQTATASGSEGARPPAAPPARWWRPRGLVRRAVTAGMKGGAAAAAGAVRAGGGLVRQAHAGRRKTGDYADPEETLVTMEQQWGGMRQAGGGAEEGASAAEQSSGVGQSAHSGSDGAAAAAPGRALNIARDSVPLLDLKAVPVEPQPGGSSPRIGGSRGVSPDSDHRGPFAAAAQSAPHDTAPSSRARGSAPAESTAAAALAFAASRPLPDVPAVATEAARGSQPPSGPEATAAAAWQEGFVLSRASSATGSLPPSTRSSLDFDKSQTEAQRLYGQDANPPSPPSPPPAPQEPPSGGQSASGAPPVGAEGEAGGGGPPGAEQLSALNILLTRAAYDLLRSTRVQEFMHKRVEKQIADIRTPPYMSAMRLVNLDLGKTPPVVTGMQAEAATPGCIMPVLSLQIAYRGEFNLTIETTVDPREAAGWSRIDRAINFVQGSHGEAQAGGREDGVAGSPDAALTGGGAASEEGVGGGGGAGGGGVGGGGSRLTRRGALMPLRKAAAAKARQIADMMGEYISKVPVRLHVKVSHLRGTMLVWIAPPPTDRLWYAFQDQPTMDIVARPEIGGHQLKYMGVANRVSSWVAAKLQVAVTNTLVFPSCGDLKLAFLLPFEPETMLSQLPSSTPVTPPRSSHQAHSN